MRHYAHKNILWIILLNIHSNQTKRSHWQLYFKRFQVKIEKYIFKTNEEKDKIVWSHMPSNFY